MQTIFSYVVRDDAGSAPNPFWGVCTLVICKPKIRLKAQLDDWIVGTGSSRSPKGNASVVYAMRVTDKMTLHNYDDWAKEERPEKIPDVSSRNWRHRLGDAVYDYSEDPPKKRPGPHNEVNRETDLGGKFALLSEHFVYFGDRAVPFPEYLLDIIKRGPGHRAPGNAPYLKSFLDWIESLGMEPNVLHGNTQLQRDI